MNAPRLGRNDPCPCGSGKKYKHCCLHKDRQRDRPGAASPAPRPDRGRADQLDHIRTLAHQLMPYLPDKEAHEVQDALEKVEELAAYDAMRDEIEAASHTLEAHRAGFEKMMRDPQAAMERAERLFSEERFAALRYTVGDVHRAFEKVGYPSRHREKPTAQDMEILIAATLCLAGDTEQRAHLARQLLLALPEYVAAGRYLDAWLIQYSAYRMVEVPDESNLFLLTMFNLAFDEWARQIDEQQRAMMRELGVDPSALGSMSIEEAAEWLKAQMADPAKKARMEAYYAAHPIVSDQAMAELTELEHNSLLLLERDDAECLHLAPEEVEKWLPVLMARLEPLMPQARQAAQQGKWDDAEVVQTMQKMLVETAREMAASIFTPERLRQFVADLKNYRHTLNEAEEQEAATYAQTTLILLDRDDLVPAENRFLVGLCFASLRAAVRAMAGTSSQEFPRVPKSSQEFPRPTGGNPCSLSTTVP